jgi:hypothetical protein
VWVLPLLLWCLFGPRQSLTSIRVLTWAWVIGTCSYVVSILIAQQYVDQGASRPFWQAGLGAIYPVLGVATLIVLAVVSLRIRPDQPAGTVDGASASDPGLPAAS